jgi:Mg2+-importing ATPase
MALLSGTILPKTLFPGLRRDSAAIRVSPGLVRAASLTQAETLAEAKTALEGLSEEEAAARLEAHGANIVATEERFTRLKLFVKACLNPLVILLSVLAIISFATAESTSDVVSGVLMVMMVVLGVSLRFIQEARADAAAAALKAMIRVTATVVRSGVAREIPLAELVPGDLVRLAAGDMIPADVRLLSCKDLFLIQASLTGESFPVEKFDTPEPIAGKTPLELKSICFLGTSVESGSATAVVIETGRRTFLGSMATAIAGGPPPTAFDKGVSSFTWLMLQFMAVMVPLVFLINGFSKHNWGEAFLFALAVAVGLTPEMLPMIVSVCLSRGAILMSHKKVIVKRLNSIQNLGAMDVLCTDKTGTLTMDHVILEKSCDVVRRDDAAVLELAFLNSHFQTGLKNVLDRAVLQHQEIHQDCSVASYSKVDEIPFDFSRKMMSVVVATPEGIHRLICKGAPESVFSRCTQFELEEELYPMDQLLLDDLKEEYDQLSADGFRVLAIAYRDCDPKAAYSKDDEQNLILKGYVAFLDPPKDTAAPAITALLKHGIAVKVLTGDNELVSRKIGKEVGLALEHVLTGAQIEALGDPELAAAAEEATLFVRLSPAHKQRIIKALQSRGHVVGFMGDGINDGPALRAADVGVSVDTAVDIAKEAADAILLEKSLMVLEEGVLEGRKVFANILKYIRMGASSNFGNMFSVIGASLWLPYLPMAPIKILTNNLLYDFSQVPIPTDEVDPEQVARPRPWSMGEIARFILFIGPCSSVFDYTTYDKGAAMLHLLRYRMGDEAFFAGVTEFLKSRSFSSADSHDFLKVMERTSGLALEEFFEQSFFKPGHPEFEIEYAYDDSTNVASLHVRQVQSLDGGTPVFKLPCEFVFYVNGEPKTYRVWIDTADQKLSFSLAGKPSIVEFDPRRWLLKKVRFEKSLDLLLAQLQGSAEAWSRAEAARQLGKMKLDGAIQGLRDAATREQFWDVRASAILAIGEIGSKNAAQALLELGVPRNRRVRRALAHALGNFKDERAREVVLSLLKTDESPYVRCEAALSLAKCWPEGALPHLKETMKTHSPNETLAEACLEAMGTIKDEEVKRIVKDCITYGNPTRIRIGALKAIKGRGSIADDEVGVCHIVPTFTERAGSGAHPLRYTVPWGSVIELTVTRKADARLYGVGHDRGGIGIGTRDRVEVLPSDGVTKVIVLGG